MSIHFYGEDSTWDDGYDEGYDDGYDDAKLELIKKHKAEVAILCARIEALKNTPLFTYKESAPGDE